MIRLKDALIKYWISIAALLVIIVHFFLTHTANLSRWKGGGFGMYTEVHYYYNEIYIDHLEQPLEELADEYHEINQNMKDVKRMPNNENLERMAKSVSKFVLTDTIHVQVWKPSIDSEKAYYSRELVNEINFIKQ